MFPLVNFTKKTCGFFIYQFIQKFKKPMFTIVQILKSLQGFQVKYKIFSNLQTTVCYTRDNLVASNLITARSYSLYYART